MLSMAKVVRFAELASLPLSRVREIKDKLGIKLFNETYFGEEANEKRKESEGRSLDGRGALRRFKVRKRNARIKKNFSLYIATKKMLKEKREFCCLAVRNFSNFVSNTRFIFYVLCKHINLHY